MTAAEMQQRPSVRAHDRPSHLSLSITAFLLQLGNTAGSEVIETRKWAFEGARPGREAMLGGPCIRSPEILDLDEKKP